MDECELDLHNCSNSMCSNTNGSYFCLCDRGYAPRDPLDNLTCYGM